MPSAVEDEVTTALKDLVDSNFGEEAATTA